jgi:DNA-binding SARP family transcriptional activator/ABC-type glycerol-3-phosphate transport system substrate-binding protein
VEYRTLGVLAVRDGHGPVTLGGRRQQLVLAVLLQHANELVTTDGLIDAVWGETPPETARKTLQVYVSRLRHQLGDGAIESHAEGYRLRVDPRDVDAERFVELADEGRRQLAADPDRAASLLRQALALWHGTPWGPLGDEPALRAGSQRLLERRLEALEDRIAADLERGELQGLVGEVEALRADHALHERLLELEMRVLYRQGRQADALAVYQQLRERLAAELGIDPSPELQQLHRAILQQDAALGRSAAGPTAAPEQRTIRNPYRGLQPFDEADAGDFFGRDELVQTLVERVEDDRFLALVGPSGCGKSSIVRAGVIPALRDHPRERTGPTGSRWQIATMVPGAHPFEALEAALLRAAPSSPAPPASLREQRRGDDLDLLRSVLRVRADDRGRLLLVVDQFEELFLLVSDAGERQRFVRNLVEAVEDPEAGLTVLVTVRADLLGRPLDEPGLGELLVAGLVSVPPLTPAQLEAACVHPAVNVGVTVEPELAAELVADVAERPGALPLFEYALTELFDARCATTLTLESYRQLGGLRGALSRRADEILDGLTEAEQDVARQVLLRLVAPGEGTEDTRRRVRRSELDELGLPAADIAMVLDRFGRARLLSFDRDAVAGQPTVEVAHEALLRAWPRVRAWIDDAREDLRLGRFLAIEADAWEGSGRHDDYLLAGSRLALYGSWSRDTSVALTTSERDLLAASRERQDRDVETESRRRERELELERRAASRLRSLVSVLTAAVLVTSILAGYAVVQSREAEEGRSEAIVLGQMYRVRQLSAAAVATRQTDPELSLLLALHAVAITDAADQEVPPETVEALHWGLQAARVPYPVGAEAAVAVLDGPQGPQGIFPLDLPDLVQLARDHIGDRQLTDAECARYLGPGGCPDLSEAFSTDLDWVQPAPAPAMSGDPALAGTTVTVMGAANDETAAAEEIQRLRERTGITLRSDQETNFESMLAPRLETGQVDVALIPQPGFLAELARAAELVELSSYLDVGSLRDTFSPHLVDLGSVGHDGTWPAPDGAVYGLPQRLDVKSLVWYPVPEFEAAGYQIPTTLDELVALTEQLVADGRVPWCHGERAGSASGWPGTDWVEDLVLHGAGPEVYDAWVAGETRFGDPEVRRAFERFDELVLQPSHVHGGRRSTVVVPIELSQQPMFDDPPGCWLAHTASFARGWFPMDAESGRDAGWFPLPPSTPQVGAPVLGAGEYLVAFTDRPEVREVVRELTGTEWGRTWVADGDWYFPANRRFPLEAYGDEGAAGVARLVHGALADGTFRYDGSDLMPPKVFETFWEQMLAFATDGPDNLDEILGRLDAVRDQVASEGGAQR